MDCGSPASSGHHHGAREWGALFNEICNLDRPHAPCSDRAASGSPRAAHEANRVRKDAAITSLDLCAAPSVNGETMFMKSIAALPAGVVAALSLLSLPAAHADNPVSMKKGSGGSEVQGSAEIGRAHV